MSAEHKAPAGTVPLFQVTGLEKEFRTRSGFRTERLRALHDVSFDLGRGQIKALVGESGSGKSTVLRILARLLPASGGSIRFDGQDLLAREPRHASLAYRRHVQMIFQDPFASLNPTQTVGYHLRRPLLRHGLASSDDLDARVVSLLETGVPMRWPEIRWSDLPDAYCFTQ